jgi:ABC-type Fe3+/spermidine/putrescine transport system ATPase subunit
MSFLTLQSLECRFAGVRAVDGIDLAIGQGEFVALLGPSGCGKTTTLRLIAGLLKPSAGTIRLGGRTLFGPEDFVPPEQRGMSMIFQSYAIWPHMNVFDNVAFGLRLRKLPAAEVERRTQRVLDIVHLGALGRRLPSELSGGQQQRVALARAIVVEPAVLLLDEPLSNLDASLREEMRFEIRRLHDELGMTSVYVTHDQTEAMATADRIVVMNEGRIEQVDAPVEIYKRPRTRFVAAFIGRTNLIDGRVEGETFRAGALNVPLPPGASGPGGTGSAISVRPHGIAIEARSTAVQPLRWPARIATRTFLGEHWDYLAHVDGLAAPLRVSCAPAQVYAPGTEVDLVVAPEAIVAVA